MVRRAAPLVLAISLGGCSLLTLGEGEYSGGTGGEPDGGESPVTEAGPLDAPAGPNGTDGGAGDVDAATNRYASTVLTDGPILYLRFGEASGTTAKATAGVDGQYAVAGIALGEPGALAGDPDTALKLTESTTRVLVPMSGASFDGTAPFSIELWAKPAAENTKYGFLADHTEWATDRRGWSLLVGTEGTGFERWATQADRNGITGAAVSAGTWHHVVATYDGSTMRLYVDAARIASGATSVVLPSRPSTLTIGRQSCDCGNGFVGSVDELAIYDKALTEMQIAAHHAAAK